MSAAEEKKLAGYRAAELVKDGMTLGLGTGSTAEQFVRALGEKVANGMKVRGVPTSEATAALAQQLNIPLITLEEAGRIDITVDGADEADPQLRLIKGGGGALLREKIVAAASDQMIVITDASKLVDPLGAFDLPVEIVPFGAGITAEKIKAGIAAFSSLDEVPVTFRKNKDNDELFLTDGGHYIVDCAMTVITDVEGLAGFLSTVPGVVDHGLFIGLATKIIVGRGDTIEVIEG